MAMFLIGVLSANGLQSPPIPIPNWAETRLYLLMCYLSIGRSGEAAKTTFDLSEWDSLYQTFFVDYAEPKIGLRKPMTYVVDADNLHVDFYHALCTYLFKRGLPNPPTNDRGEKEPDWLFPSSASQQPATAAKKITRVIHSMANVVTGIFPDHTGTSLRIGT